MRYLADTQILLWSFNQPHRLSPHVATILGDEDASVYYSPVSIWEIAIKYRLGKLDLCGHTPEEFALELENSFYRRKELSDACLASSYRLPRHHKDPFDRMLFWEAITSDFVLLSADGASNLYHAEGLQVIH
ncbi:MAG: type II toxin-antitoxin system VapC family toxin [Coriobacteriales bacterium]|jgi:PIN domain nuclease of toxin-antitoxin system|nr:type II toxin-antitoxin system VapC family toxin [Coriobacteriales bacterium]